MAYQEVDSKEQSKLKRIKANVERAMIYWKENCKRFHQFQKFAFKTALTPSDEASLNAVGKPVIEFNITNAPISRLCGEFSKQEPSIEVSSEHGAQVDPQVIEVVDGHLRHILFESKKHNMQYNVYRDTLSGGFSSFKVTTDYANEMSFDQIIKVERSYEPTMTLYDPMAKEVDKSDAEFCFEVFLMDKEVFKKEYPDIPIEELSFIKLENGFSWSYKNQQQYVVVLIDYYEKKKTNKSIVKLANGKTMLKSLYPEFLKEWEKQGLIEQPPVVIDERKSQFTSITRYRVMETHILEEEETSFKYLPLVFADGDSVVIQEDSSATMELFTKPYIYHAEGLQRLTNFSGQVIANDFENMVMHKFMIAEEALPTQEDALDAWNNVQQAATLVYKALYDNNPEQQLPTPQAVQRVPLPQEVLATFNNSMQMLQNILGSYDASLATQDNDISGKAIVESATLSNAAAMPYVVNYMQALTQVANIVVDLMPKYYKTPRTIPVMNKEGKRDYIKINQPGGIDINYDSNDLQVKVEAGVNFSIAKNRALQQITLLMKVSEEFAAFMNDAGLETLLDNIEFRNVDVLKSKVEEWKKKKEEMAKTQPNPEMMKLQLIQQEMQEKKQLAEMQMQNEMKKTELKSEEIQGKAMLDTEKLLVDQKKVDNDRLKIMQQMGESKVDMVVGLAKAQAEETRAQADMHIKAHDIGHGHAMDIAEHHHEVVKHHHEIKKHEDEMNKPKKESDNG